VLAALRRLDAEQYAQRFQHEAAMPPTTALHWAACFGIEVCRGGDTAQADTSSGEAEVAPS
jgi:hypothetical protein